MTDVVITQRVKKGEGEGVRRMVSFALSLQAWCLPNTHGGTTNLRAMFFKVRPMAHLHQNHWGSLLSSKIPQHLPEGQKPVSSWPFRALMPQKFEKLGLKGLELPTTPMPKDPCLGQGCTGPLGGWCQLVSPGVGTLAPTALGRQAGRLALGQYWGK